MDNEKNLKKALKNLPAHQAPESIWEKINFELEQDEADKPLQEALKKLPVHKAPESVWKGLESQLPESESQQPIIRRLRPVLAIAASLLLVVGFYFGFRQNPVEGTEFAYSEEVLDDRIQINNLEADDEAFAMIEEICAARDYLCNNDIFKSLKSEFDELNMAHEELSSAISEFNTNAQLISELTSIEMERTEVFKQMIALL